MFIQVWNIGLQKRTKMIENHVHIRSAIILNRLGALKNDRNEINSMDDQCIWLCIRVTFSWIGKVLKLPDG